MSQASSYPLQPNAADYYRRGSSHAVILTHGLAGSPYDLRELADALHQAGATVLVKRLAGHGTDPHDLAQRTLADWRRSLDEAAAQLEGVESLLLVGNSFGGNLLIDLSLRRALPVSGFVLLSTPYWTYGEWWKRLLLPFVLPWKFSVKKSWVKNEGRADYLARGSYLDVPLRAYQEFLSFLRAESRNQFRAVTAPVLLAYSLHDTVIKPHSAEFIYQAVASTDKRLYWVEDTYHSPLSSSKKGQLFSTIIDFFRMHAETWPDRQHMVRS